MCKHKRSIFAECRKEFEHLAQLCGGIALRQHQNKRRLIFGGVSAEVRTEDTAPQALIRGKIGHKIIKTAPLSSEFCNPTNGFFCL